MVGHQARAPQGRPYAQGPADPVSARRAQEGRLIPRWQDRFPARLGLADPATRRGVRVLYKFALEAEAAAVAGEHKRLEAWRRWLAEGAGGEPPEPWLSEPVAVLRAAAQAPAPLAALAAAWRADAERTRFETYDELLAHARATGGAVGRMALGLWGRAGAAALPLGDTLWTAFALTASLRDTREQVARGRIYLPVADLAEQGYGEADLRMGVVNDRFRSLMKVHWKRVRALYEECRSLPGRLAWPVSTEVRYGWMAGGALLAHISRDGFDVLHARPALSRWEGPRLAAGALLPL